MPREAISDFAGFAKIWYVFERVYNLDIDIWIFLVEVERKTPQWYEVNMRCVEFDRNQGGI